MIFISHQWKKGGNKDYCSHFSAIFETTSKFPIVFLRLVFGKVRVDGFAGTRLEIDINIWIWFEDNYKEFMVQIEILTTVCGWVAKQQSNL